MFSCLDLFFYSSFTFTAGLTDAQIIGIVFGVLGVIVVAFLCVVCFCAAVVRYRQRNMMLYSKPQAYNQADDRLHVLYNVPYAQRTGRSNFNRFEEGSDAYRLPSYLVNSEFDFSERTSDIFRSSDGYSDESISVNNPSYNTEEDRRMQQLAEVITQSPYLNVSSKICRKQLSYTAYFFLKFKICRLCGIKDEIEHGL